MDIDIDFPTSFDPLTIFGGVRASMVKDGRLVKHPAGVYLQNIAVDPITRLSAIPYDKAEELGYFKIDFLHLHVLDNFSSKDEIRQLIKIPPDWSLLENKQVVETLFQISNHYNILKQVKPKTIQELADCIALIRPAKRHLLKEYTENKEEIRKSLYTRPDNDQYYFKKGHAISYALTIVLQLHLIKGGII